MKLIFVLILGVFCFPFLIAQDLECFTNGNGSEAELAIANQALNCLTHNCIAGLEKSGFIRNKTNYDVRKISHALDSLANLLDAGSKLSKLGIRYDDFEKELMFSRTIYFEPDRAFFF